MATERSMPTDDALVSMKPSTMVTLATKRSELAAENMVSLKPAKVAKHLWHTNATLAKQLLDRRMTTTTEKTNYPICDNGDGAEETNKVAWDKGDGDPDPVGPRCRPKKDNGKPRPNDVWCKHCEFWLHGPTQWEGPQIGKRHRKNRALSEGACYV